MRLWPTDRWDEGPNRRELDVPVWRHESWIGAALPVPSIKVVEPTILIATDPDVGIRNPQIACPPRRPSGQRHPGGPTRAPAQHLLTTGDVDRPGSAAPQNLASLGRPASANPYAVPAPSIQRQGIPLRSAIDPASRPARPVRCRRYRTSPAVAGPRRLHPSAARSENPA